MLCTYDTRPESTLGCCEPIRRYIDAQADLDPWCGSFHSGRRGRRRWLRDHPLTAPVTQTVSADAKAYAREYGVPELEAQKRLDLQGDAGNVLEQSRLEEAPGFAGLWLQHQPDFRLVIRTTGATDQIKSRIGELRIPVTLETGARTSWSDLVAGASKAAQAIGPQFEMAGAWADPKRAAVVLDIQPPFHDTSLMRAEESRLSTELGVSVVLNQLSSRADDDVMRGGNVVGGCTSAFSIGTYSGSYGFLTNAHCGDLYSTTSCALTFDFTSPSCWRDHAYGASHDVQWRTVVGDYATAQFWDGSAYRPVYTSYSWSAQQVGWYTCHYGQGSGYSCGTIASKTYQPTYPGACPGGPCNFDWMLVSGSSLACGAGDSGGPWFVAGSAYGVHKGSPGSSCVYMPIDRITAMSVFILTQ